MPVKPIPDGYPAMIPYLIVDGASQFIDFIRTVFDAQLTENITRPDGSISHAELRIRDSVIMLSEASAAHKATPVMLYFYVEDVDTLFGRAIGAGASVITAPATQFYGDRSGGCREPSGNTIWISTHIEDVPPDELHRRAAAQGQGQA